MIELTNEAQGRLEEYLRRMRASLRGCASVDAAEVEQDIRAHIRDELHDAPRPANVDALEKVLDHLGEPDQWVPAEDIPWWRRVLGRLQHGPEDWRLAYLSFGALVLGAILWACEVEAAALVLLAASFVLSRASLAMTDDPAKLCAVRKWLVYPPLVVVSLALLAGLLVAPGAAVAGIYAEFEHDTHAREWAASHLGLQFASSRGGDLSVALGWLAWGGVVTGAWWVVLTVLAAKWPGAVRAIFRPLLDRFRRRTAVVLIVVALLLTVAFVAAAVATITLPPGGR